MICVMLARIRYWILPLCLAIIACVAVLPIAIHYYLTHLPSSLLTDSDAINSEFANLDRHPSRISMQDLRYCDSDGKDHDKVVAEYERIKYSVLNELRDLEQRYNGIKSEIKAKTEALDGLIVNVAEKEVELGRLHNAIKQAALAEREALEMSIPLVWSPLKLQNPVSTAVPSKVMVKSVPQSDYTTDSCVDFSRCSLVFPFRIFLYSYNAHSGVHHDFVNLIRNSSSVTTNSAEACFFMVVLDCGVFENLQIASAVQFSQYLMRQRFWKEMDGGHNHVILLLDGPTSLKDCLKFSLQDVQFGHSMLVSADFQGLGWKVRNGFDVIIPPIQAQVSLIHWSNFTALLPVWRKYLISAVGGPQDSFHGKTPSFTPTIKSMLLRMRKVSEQDRFGLFFDCEQESCTFSGMRHILQESTFALIFTADQSAISVANQISASLLSAAIPIIVNDPNATVLQLPFMDYVDWSRFTIHLPFARLPELHFFARTFADRDIVEMRRNGRLAMENYLMSNSIIFNAVLATFRTRLMLPPDPVQNALPMSSHNNLTWFPDKVTEMPFVPEIDEYLGPVEVPYSSIQFQNNFSNIVWDTYNLWNAFKLPNTNIFPSSPFDNPLPSEAKFKGSGSGFRLINKGIGGSGKEFSEALGGNVPREQFTVVMLTYEREPVLMQSLRRLNNLPYLNKVVVVWNSDKQPSKDLLWPKLSVPIAVVMPGKNSLNNRFLPYDVIDTDAILSIDDDAHLRHDEIVFGFRVWRESRDRIVGFPGRYHAYDIEQETWMYNANHTCQLSMVLTGAAFFHKVKTFCLLINLAISGRNNFFSTINPFERVYF